MTYQLSIAISSRPPMALKDTSVLTSQIGNPITAFDLAGCLHVQLVDAKGYAVY